MTKRHIVKVRYIVKNGETEFCFTEKENAQARLELLEKYFPGRFKLISRKIVAGKS